MKTGSLLALVLALVLAAAGCGGSSSGSSDAGQTVPAEESGSERGNLVLGAEAAAYTLCIELGIDPCASEADRVAATKTFIAKTKEVAADNGLSPAAVDEALAEAADEVGKNCAECERLLEAELAG